MLRLVCVVLVSLCLSAGAQGAGSGALTGRDFGLKLCGREFIRAVIFTCGGSRWRRGKPDGGDPFLESPYSEQSDTEGSLFWPRGRSAERQGRPTFSFLDVLNALGILNDHEPGAASGFNEISQARSSHTPWAYPNRRKRNFSLGLAGMCCNLGCTKNDIGRLC